MLIFQEIHPIFAVQGDDQTAMDAFDIVVKSAKVMVDSMTASMRLASQTTWFAPASTSSVVIGGPNGEYNEWV